MKSISSLVREHAWVGWVLFLGTVVAVFAFGMLVASLIERKQEGRMAFQQLAAIQEMESNSRVWGENFPREYKTWLTTSDTSFKSKWAGSRERDALAEDPRWVVLWAGYPFSKDYNQSRGHYFAVNDARESLRTNTPQPGTCWTCKSSDVPRLMHERGIAEFYKDRWDKLGPEVSNSIGCLDCHDAANMNLKISRPALVEAFNRMGRDINAATYQDMRALVCAQCHVEYYFKGDGKYLTFPWDKGLTAEDMEAYYDEVGHTDFVHKLSRTKVIKPQHPDWELFTQGIHAQRGLACADCHMPYRADGSVKFSDHQVRSPLADVSRTCGVCHRESEEALRRNVEERQDKVKEMMSRGEDALVHAHVEAKAAWDAGATEAEMEPILKLIRAAQWRIDFVAASVGAPFHAPVECSRLLAAGIEKAQEARLTMAPILAAHKVPAPVPLPDISTKEKAQAFIGLDIAQERKTKEEIRKTALSSWPPAM